MKEVAGAGTKMGLQINFFVQRTIGVAWTGFRIILKEERRMSGRLRNVQKGAIALVGVFLLAISHTAPAQEAKPQETKGVSIEAKDVLGLAAQIPELKGYALRIRQISMEPGAVIAHHSHGNRPIAVYVVSGEFTEVRDGASEITRHPGEQWVEAGPPKWRYTP